MRAVCSFSSLGHAIGQPGRGLVRVLSLILLAAILVASGAAARETATGADICRAAAHQAAARSGVPLDVLMAISLTETGRKRDGAFDPWPWTVNMEGKGVWFDSRDEAYAYAIANYRRGARSFDIGCFQINYKWHGEAFSSIEAMFDPAENAAYAARHLLELYAEKGNWPDAAGAYHSRTAKYADKYKARFQRIRAGLDPSETLPATFRGAEQPGQAVPPRVNTYPLLRTGAGGEASNGSLVRLASKSGSGGLIALGKGPLF